MHRQRIPWWHQTRVGGEEAKGRLELRCVGVLRHWRFKNIFARPNSKLETAAAVQAHERRRAETEAALELQRLQWLVPQRLREHSECTTSWGKANPASVVGHRVRVYRPSEEEWCASAAPGGETLDALGCPLAPVESVDNHTERQPPSRARDAIVEK